MSLLYEYLEPFELVGSTGIPYGEIQAIFFQEQNQNRIFAKGEPPINDYDIIRYDIIRRKSDDSAFRIFCVKLCPFPNGEEAFTSAILVPYRLWKGEYVYSPQ